MRHIIFTRIALDFVCPKHHQLHNGDRTESWWGSRKPVKRVIKIWRQLSSQSYEYQTVKADVKVVLLYSECNQDLMDAHSWPSWCELLKVDVPAEGIAHWCKDNIKAGERITTTRIDADDSWSIDFFKYLNSMDYAERTLILYKRHHQYDIATDRLTSILWHPSPMFATIYWPSFPSDYDPEAAAGKTGSLLGVLGNHAWYAEVPHVEAERTYVIRRFDTSHENFSNIMSRFGYIGNNRLDKAEYIAQNSRVNDRFFGYGNLNDEEDVRWRPTTD